MRAPSPEASRLRAAAAAALGCVLVVLAVSAAIRLNAAAISPLPFLSGTEVTLLRVLHRTAASLAVLIALWIGWVAWRTRHTRPERAVGAAVALALTFFLSIIGIVGGQEPPRAIAVGNLLGGLTLAATLAWLAAATASGTNLHRAGATMVLTAAALLALQALIGARLSIFSRTELPAMPAHGLLGLAAAALIGWVALARIGGALGKLVFALALAVPAAGFSALQYEHSAAAALAHAAVAALFIIATAYAFGRNA